MEIFPHSYISVICSSNFRCSEQTWFDVAISPKDQTQRKWQHFCEEMGMDDDTLFIRPSGNPATPSTMLDMMSSGDITAKSMEIVSFDSCRVFAEGHAAVVTFTQHSVFNYKGKDNDDIAKWTMVLEKSPSNCWKIIHAHRGTGQAPSNNPAAVGQ